MEEHLKKVYGFNNFREYQKDIINDILDKNNVFAILPTGGGKSLLYQFPSTYQKKITVVVSPLISLMNDQCLFLNSKNIKAACLNSETKVDYADLKNMSLIYTTPEFITTRIKLLTELNDDIGLFAIDEAHCISQWSHDFRESYQQLKIIKDMFPKTPLLAVTATATPRVLEEMYELLNITEATEYSLGTRRNNLAIKVLPKKDFLKCQFEEPTIIYTQTRKLSESLSNDICNKGIKCSYYHAGLTVDEKKRSHEAFMKGEILVIVATISFGMGIDKSDIRHVINYGIPTDIETYYQEIGRAGRDGIMSKATLYYNEGDFSTANFLISKSVDPNQIKIKKESLEIFRKYISENCMCRQQVIDFYFEKGSFPNNDSIKHIPKCNICDNCSGEKVSNMVLSDINEEAKFIINYIKTFHYKHQYYIGIEKLSKAIMKDCGTVNIKSHKLCRSIIQTLISKKILSNINIGNGRFVIGMGTEKISQENPITIYIDKCQYDKPKPKNNLSFQDINDIRNRLANKYNINPTTFINEKVLFNILEKSPKNLQELWRVDGISQDFIINHGDELINNLKPTKKVLGDTKMITYNLYKQGKTIKEICNERNLKDLTVETHILDVWENNEDSVIDLEYADLCDAKRNEISKAINIVGINKLKSIKDIVNSNITYFQIKLTILLKKLNID